MFKNKNTLYLSYDGMTDPLGQSQVLPYLVGLSKTGKYAVTLISCEKEEAFEKGRHIIEAICKGNNIDWHPIKYTKNPPVISTLKDIYSMRKLAAKLHKEKRFSLVHCRSYISALVGLWLKNKFGVKMVFDMRGFWADERVDGKLWPQENSMYKYIYNFFKRKETEFLEKADYTISLTNCAKDEIHSWGNRVSNNPVEIQVIPCCVDLDLFNRQLVTNQQVDKLKVTLGLKNGQFVLLYLGAVGTWYMLPEMLDFFKVLLQKKPDARFLFVTAEDPEYILAAAKSKNIQPEYLIITRSSRTDVPLYLSLADASVFFIKPAYSKKASSPTKQGELMAMGVPVICNAGVGDTDYVINKYHSGIAVNSFTNEAYEKAIDQLPALQQLDKQKIREGAEDFFSLQKGVASYNEVYERILGRS